MPGIHIARRLAYEGHQGLGINDMEELKKAVNILLLTFGIPMTPPLRAHKVRILFLLSRREP